MRFTPTRLLALASGALLFTACSADTVTSPTLRSSLVPISPAMGSAYWLPAQGQVKICMYPSDGATLPAGFVGNFATSASAGSVEANTNLVAEQCSVVWLPAGATLPVNVSTDMVGPAGFDLDSVTVVTLDGERTVLKGAGVTGADVTVTATGPTAGFAIWFKVGGANPPTGGDGCTPGYWKQTQHFGSWTSPYTPTTTFASVFGSNAYGSATLLDVLSNGGGGMAALGRHTVAALLNSASATVDYGIATPQDVINAFNAAVAGGSVAIENQKNIFADLNELDCGLGRAELQ